MKQEHWLATALNSSLISPEVAAKVAIEIGEQAARIRELETKINGH